MPTTPPEVREEYYKVLARFMKFCNRDGGPSWLVRLHHFMLAEMGRPVVDPRPKFGPQKFSSQPDRPARPRARRRALENTTFCNLTTGQTCVSVQAAADAAGVSVPGFMHQVDHGRPVRGHRWVIVPAAAIEEGDDL